MLNITYCSTKPNQNCNEASPHNSQNGHQQKNPQTIHAEESVKRREPSYTIGQKINWYLH